MPQWRRFRRLFGLEPAADVDAELAFHLDMRMRELVEQGESPERARELALRRFGDFDGARRECVAINERRRRRIMRTEYFAELKQDVGYALRMLRRTPGFTAVALFTLALGIGATSAIFSVVHGVLLESLPFRDADRLYQVRMLYPDGTHYASLSAPDFMSVREEAGGVFEQVEAYDVRLFTLLGAGEPREIQAALVSDNLFGLLGLRVSAGRAFDAGENHPSAARTALLSDGFWRRAFGGDPSALGRALTIGGNSYTVIGILAPDAKLPDAADIYVPVPYDARFDATTATGRRGEFLSVIGRARPGLTLEQIDGDLKRIGARLQIAFPQTNQQLTFSVIALRDIMVGDVRRPLFVLLGAVGLVLLVACGNVANLLLARGSARQGELAVRAALGAGRARLLRQLVTEAIVLGVSGGVLGLLLAYWGTRSLIAAQPADIPRLEEVGLDGTVAVFTFGLALATSLVFGIVPALQAKSDPRALQESGRGGDATRGTHRLRAALVVGEMTLAVVLLIGAGLLIRSFVELTRVDSGFQPEGALTVRLTLQGEAYRDAERVRSRLAELEPRLRALPGVSAVAVTSVLPLSGHGALWNFAVEGAPPPPPDVNAEIAIAIVTPDYFRAIGTPLRRGRMLSTADHAKAPPVALINEAGVRRWFPNQDPIGKRVLTDATREIVGVVADVRQRGPGQPAAPQLFIPYAQRTTSTVRLVVRTAGDPLSLAAPIRSEVRALDPNLPLTEFRLLEQVVSTSVARPRFYAALLALFAGVALALAATGIFGVMSYAVAQRAREISIRLALGARTGDVLRMVVGRAMLLAGGGVALGIVAAIGLGRFIQNQLFGVKPFDPLTLVAVIAVLLASAALASFLPARRAAGMDPASTFRQG